MSNWNHLLESEPQFFFQIKKNFSCSINFIFRFNLKQKNHREKKKTTNQFRKKINFRRKSDSKSQAIDFIDESNKKTNRAFYNKISYVRNAMIILIINKVFFEQFKISKYKFEKRDRDQFFILFNVEFEKKK